MASTERLKHVFTELCLRFSNDQSLIGDLWKEIQKQYNGSKRPYHNLHHLANMMDHLDGCRHLVADWDCVLFALFYHDLVYNVSSKDNEEKSAVEAGIQMNSLGVPVGKISATEKLILATKSHTLSSDNDINLFTDADLSILGASRGDYEKYSQQVRKEYWIYPDLLYNPGRKKVLQHFLDMSAIFKTDHFGKALESNARENLKWELGVPG